MDKKRFFKVTVMESYHYTYTVLARDEQEADDLVNAMVNNGDVDPTKDGNQSYARETEVERSNHPHEGDEYWEFDWNPKENGECTKSIYREPKASKRRRKADKR